jgi:hypothetical protein
MGHPKYDRTAADGAPTQLADEGWSAPRLSKALLEADAGQYDCYRTALELGLKASPPTKEAPTLRDKAKFDAHLADLLGHIAERLSKGLDEAWISRQAYDWSPDPAKLQGSTDEEKANAKLVAMWDTAVFYNSQEERWARAFTEKFLFAMYAEPGNSYKIENYDVGIYDAFFSVFPLAAECQHISTLCVLSRGAAMTDIQLFTTPKFGDPKPFVTGISCSGNSVKLKAFDPAKSKTFNHDDPDAAVYTRVPACIKLGVAPGSIAVFNPGTKDETSQDLGETTHCGSVLRVTGARIQFIDTGVLGGDGEGAAEGGTVDHEFTSDRIREWSSMVGIGGCKPPNDLDGCIQRLVASRPLGVARLVIADTSGTTPVLRYVSKLLHLKYPVSSLIWSLRNLPSAGLTVLWFVYLTEGKRSKAEPDRGWSDALVLWDGAKKPKEVLEEGWGQLVLSQVVRGEPSGKARIFRRKKTNKVDGFYEDLSTSKNPPKSPPALMQGEPITDTEKLGAWCMKWESFGQQLVHKPDGDAEIGEGSTGVALFDP